MPIGTPFTQLVEVDSTNNYAIRMVQAQMAEHGATWFAHSQTNGKGQRAKSWQSVPGENIIVSSIIDPNPLVAEQQFIMIAAVALGCFDFFNSFSNGDTAIKWPNDLYWRDRKAGGILLESIIRGNSWKYAVAGIGININQVSFPPHLPNPVSLRQITGKRYEPVALTKMLCECLEKRWQQVCAGKAETILTDYNKVLFKLNEPVRFTLESALFCAVVKGANARGELLLETGTVSAFAHGSIEWLG